MTDAEFYRIYTFLKSRYGVDMSRKKEIIKGRLENYVSRQGFETYQSYMDALEADITGEMEKKLVDILTTNHTYFMRESEHFDFMKSEVLPYLKKKEARNRDLRIWCGAASTEKNRIRWQCSFWIFSAWSKTVGTHRFWQRIFLRKY